MKTTNEYNRNPHTALPEHLQDACNRFSGPAPVYKERVVEPEEPKETWEHLTIGRFIIMTIGLIAFFWLLGHLEYLAYWR